MQLVGKKGRENFLYRIFLWNRIFRYAACVVHQKICSKLIYLPLRRSKVLKTFEGLATKYQRCYKGNKV